MTDNLGLTQKQTEGILAKAYENRMPGAGRIELDDLENILKANTVKYNIGIDWAYPARENFRCVMIPFIGDEQMPDKNTFTKQIQKWGLLSKPNTDRGRWSFVQQTNFYFDHEVDAYKKALELTMPGHYIYKPIPIKIEAEIPEGE